MSQRARINGFTAWVNIRLGNQMNLLSDVLVDLMTGTRMKQLIESFTGSNFQRIGSYDGLTQQQKVTRAEWLLEELKKWRIIPKKATIDAPLFAARNSDEVFDLLWLLVSYDIWFLWERMEFLQHPDLNILVKYPFTWIPEPAPEAPKKKFKVKTDLMAGFGAAAKTYEEIPSDEPNPLDSHVPFPLANDMKSFNKKLPPSSSRYPKPQKCIMDMIRAHLKMTKDGRKLSVYGIDDLADIRVLCALVNSFIPNAFTTEIFLNDRWAIDVVLRCIEEIFNTESTFDAEDLLEGDIEANGTYFCFFFMAGYRFRQHRAVVLYHEQLEQLRRECEFDMEEIPNPCTTTPQEKEKTRIMMEMQRLRREKEELLKRFDLKKCQEWVTSAEAVLDKTQAKIKAKMHDRFDTFPVPRSITISSLCLSLLVNLSLTNGAGFYLMKSKETFLEGRRLVLKKKSTGEYIEDFSRRSDESIRKVLNLPEEEPVEIDPEDYPLYNIFAEAESRSTSLSETDTFLYQVFPGSTVAWQRTLLKASRDGDLNTVQNLVRFFRLQSSFINCFEPSTGDRPLHLAAHNGHVKVAQLLMESGANYNAKNKPRYTPFFSAIEGTQREMCHLLIEWGCNIHAKSIKGTTAIDQCLSTPLKVFCIRNYEFYSSNVPAIIAGDMDVLYRVVEEHRLGITPLSNLRSRCINGSTIMHTAAYFGAARIVKRLLKLRVDINLQDYKGATPLHRAKDPAMTKLLLYCGARLNAVDNDLNIPLHIKCYGEAGEPSELSVIEVLLEAGSYVASPNARGLLPIHCAAMQGRIDVITLLLEKDKEGKILEAIKVEDEDHPPSLIHLALANDFAECAQWLLDHNFKMKPGEGDQLFKRVITGQLKLSDLTGVAEFLLNHGGADANIRYPEGGNSPLHYVAAIPDSAELVVLLLDYGADSDAANDDHSTPLCAACQANNLVAASLLLEYGANVRAKNNQGLTALDYIPDYQEWIQSALFDDDMVARMRAYSLKHTRDLVRAITKKVKPASASGKSLLETMEGTLTSVLASRPNSQAYFRPLSSTPSPTRRLVLPPLT